MFVFKENIFVKKQRLFQEEDFLYNRIFIVIVSLKDIHFFLPIYVLIYTTLLIIPTFMNVLNGINLNGTLKHVVYFSRNGYPLGC